MVGHRLVCENIYCVTFWLGGWDKQLWIVRFHRFIAYPYNTQLLTVGGGKYCVLLQAYGGTRFCAAHARPGVVAGVSWRRVMFGVGTGGASNW